MATYKKITKGGYKVQVDSAVRDGSGNKIDINYSTKQELQQGLATREVVGACYTKAETDNLITNEATTRQTADTELTTNLGLEKDARINADNTLQANIDSEATARSTKDTDLQEQITNLQAKGRYLSGWDCTTGKPLTNPTTALPYAYKSGDYYIVAKVSETTNYIPNGTQYDGNPSTTTTTESISAGDYFNFDGAVWNLLPVGKLVEFVNIAGEPSDNVKLKAVLDNKTDKTIAGTNGTSTMFNEIDGGGAKFVHNDGTESFVGVNDGGEDGLAMQMYIDKLVDGKWKGAKLDGTLEGIYYTVGDKSFAERRVEENLLATKGDLPKKMPYNYIRQVADYMFETQYSGAKIDYDWANQFFKSIPEPTNIFGGGCTAIMKGNRILRNLDWTYDQNVEFIIRTVKDQEKGIFGSVGISTAIKSLTKDFVESGVYSDKYNLVPFVITDGVNDAGLYIQTNVVTGMTYNLNPTATEECCITMATRYILDHCGSIEDIKTKFLDKVHIYSSNATSYGAHFFVAQGKEWAIIELTESGYNFVTSETSRFPIMTNFRTTGITFDEMGYVNWDSIEEYGIGVERYDIATYGLVNDLPLETLREQLLYTNTYKLTGDERWTTELTGVEDPQEPGHKLTVMDAKIGSDRYTHYDSLFEIERQHFAERTREDGKDTWQTTHSAIYDLDAKSINIVIQERLKEPRVIYFDNELFISTYDVADYGIDIEDLYSTQQLKGTTLVDLVIADLAQNKPVFIQAGIYKMQVVNQIIDEKQGYGFGCVSMTPEVKDDYNPYTERFIMLATPDKKASIWKYSNSNSGSTDYSVRVVGELPAYPDSDVMYVTGLKEEITGEGQYKAEDRKSPTGEYGVGFKLIEGKTLTYDASNNLIKFPTEEDGVNIPLSIVWKDIFYKAYVNVVLQECDIKDPDCIIAWDDAYQGYVFMSALPSGLKHYYNMGNEAKGINFESLKLSTNSATFSSVEEGKKVYGTISFNDEKGLTELCSFLYNCCTEGSLESHNLVIDDSRCNVNFYGISLAYVYGSELVGNAVTFNTYHNDTWYKQPAVFEFATTDFEGMTGNDKTIYVQENSNNYAKGIYVFNEDRFYKIADLPLQVDYDTITYNEDNVLQVNSNTYPKPVTLYLADYGFDVSDIRKTLTSTNLELMKTLSTLLDTNATVYLVAGEDILQVNGKFGGNMFSCSTARNDSATSTPYSEVFTIAVYDEETVTWSYGKIEDTKERILVDESSTEVTQELATNTSYRYLLELTSLSIGIGKTDLNYESEVVFKSGATPTTFSTANIIKWSGDDIVENAFYPVANKTYTILFWYDGININAIVRGV